uniref:Uncharacterized protein n=1 Tax=Periophthalmus magnuspinnatus TaxID=409849 RepID=A0A3B4BH72_9GOBI
MKRKSNLKLWDFRRGNTYRGTRRRRDDDRTQRPVPLAEVKVSPPKFDLAASNFPPLPGCVVSTQGEPVLENRMADVVRGLYRDKVSGVERAEIPPPKVTPRVPVPPVNSTSTQSVPARPQPAAVSAPTAQKAPAPATATIPTPTQEPRKLSYAEVCQRPPKDPPPASAPAPSGSSTGQPLRELRVNKSEEGSNSGSADKQEKGHDREGGWECKESRSTRDRDSQGHYRSNGPRGPGGLKFRDQRRAPQARRSSPQGNYRHTGKEQNIPPVSPK